MGTMVISLDRMVVILHGIRLFLKPDPRTLHKIMMMKISLIHEMEAEMTLSQIMRVCISKTNLMPGEEDSLLSLMTCCA